VIKFATVILIGGGLLSHEGSWLAAAESAAKTMAGISRIQLVTDSASVTPGESVTVALLIEPLPGHHTYWRGPGIVGVATRFEWSLPPGFSAGDVLWPPPQKVLMAGITAYGYKNRTMLLTEIQTPKRIEGTEVTFNVKCAWMACGTSCHPGVDDFSLTLPLNRSETPLAKDATLTAEFGKIRQSVPRPAPSTWKITPRLPSPDQIQLDLTIPGLTPASLPTISFYCYDLQVNSDEKQQPAALREGGAEALRLTLVRPDFAPRSPAAISGVLHCPGGWPGLDSPYVEISAPWPEGTFTHE
jgi:DsbC/DsbD-like thiol-disulfide interchange protein